MSDEEQREYDNHKISHERIVSASKYSRRIVLAISIFFLILGIVLLPQGFDREAGEDHREADCERACDNYSNQAVVPSIVNTQSADATAQHSSVEEQNRYLDKTCGKQIAMCLLVGTP